MPRSSNGKTRDFESLNLGSIPRRGSIKHLYNSEVRKEYKRTARRLNKIGFTIPPEGEAVVLRRYLCYPRMQHSPGPKRNWRVVIEVVNSKYEAPWPFLRVAYFVEDNYSDEHDYEFVRYISPETGKLRNNWV